MHVKTAVYTRGCMLMLLIVSSLWETVRVWAFLRHRRTRPVMLSMLQSYGGAVIPCRRRLRRRSCHSVTSMPASNRYHCCNMQCGILALLHRGRALHVMCVLTCTYALHYWCTLCWESRKAVGCGCAGISVYFCWPRLLGGEHMKGACCMQKGAAATAAAHT
jgi:hypothetical protein